MFHRFSLADLWFFHGFLLNLLFFHGFPLDFVFFSIVFPPFFPYKTWFSFKCSFKNMVVLQCLPLNPGFPSVFHGFSPAPSPALVQDRHAGHGPHREHRAEAQAKHRRGRGCQAKARLIGGGRNPLKEMEYFHWLFILVYLYLYI